MRKIKKLVATAMAAVMICGFAVTAHAAAHVHAYSYDSTQCYNSFNSIQHQYVVSTTTKPSGEVVYEYGSCQLVIYQYRDLYKCGCGAAKYENYHSKTWHANCGRGWE